MGFDRNLTHLDGHIVRLVRDGVTQPGMSSIHFVGIQISADMDVGFVQTIRGEGMPTFQKSTHGDLYVEYNVVLPVELPVHMRRSE